MKRGPNPAGLRVDAPPALPSSRSRSGPTPAAAAVIAALERIDPEFLLYVPCSSGAAILDHFGARSGTAALSIAKEEEGIGILAGLVLAGRRAVLFMQDTGIGNSLTALTTFAQPYHVPSLILATRTGGAAEINSAVPGYSDRVPDLLHAAGLYHRLFDARLPLPQWEPELVGLSRYARISHRPVVALIDVRWS